MSGALPAGTVTMLFADVEGSTRTLDRVGVERYSEALQLQRRCVREAIRVHGGHEMGTEGDSFFVVFSRASDALAAAAAAQQSLGEAPWPGGVALKVRMGVHTGEPLAADGGYVGMDVHRAARIAAAGHGGQVLVSATTAALVDSSDLRRLGEHRFKDMAAAEPVYQLGEEAFPPIRALHRTNLPVPETLFLGRDRELRDLADLIVGDARLVTVTGPGGCGKTRLSLQAAADVSDEFADGVFWVALAPLRDPSAVESALAQGFEVLEQPGLTPLESVIAAFANRRALFLIDNCEHLLGAVASASQRLLETCGGVVIVCSSRERLGLRAERLYPVAPMAPADGVLLFAERARAVDPSFMIDEHVPVICEAVDELPLAIELAAARVRILSTETIRKRLAGRLSLLASRDREVDERQRTLEATISWSYELLEDEEKRALRGLSVFAGGCTLEAAEEVAMADLDLLESLADKSLLRHRMDEARQDRYWLLETIREFAAARLAEACESDELTGRHLDHFVARANAFTAFRFYDVAVDSASFKADRANYRLVIHDATRGRNANVATKLVASLGAIWRQTGQIIDGYNLMLAAVMLRGGSTADRRRALVETASTAIELREYPQAAQLLDDAEQIADDPDPRTRYDILHTRSFLAARLGDYDAATDVARRATAAASEVGSEELELEAIRMELQLTRVQAMDRVEPDRDALERCLAIAHSLIERARLLGREALLDYELSGIYFGLGRYTDSLRFEQRFLLSQDHDSRTAIFSVFSIGIILGRIGEYSRAVTLVTAARTRWESDGYDTDREDSRYLAEFEASARANLASEAYEHAVQDAQRLRFEDAIDLALSAAG